MSENTSRLSLISTQSSNSLTPSLEPKASGLPQGSFTNDTKNSVLKPLPSELPQKGFPKTNKKLSKKYIKSNPLSLPTGKKKRIAKKETKKEIKPILKKVTPAKTRPNSLARNVKGNPNQENKSTRTSNFNRLLKIAAPKRQQSLTVGVTLPGKTNELSSSKSTLSVISKVSSWSASQKSSIRDDISRDYLLGSTSNSQSSALTTFSNKTQISTVSQESKKSQKKFSGIHKILTLKNKPKEAGQTKDRVTIEAQPRKLLKSLKYDQTPSSNSEEELKSDAEGPYSKPEEQDETALRSAFLKVFGSLIDINDISSTESLDRKDPDTEVDYQYVPPVDRHSSKSDASNTSISSINEIEMFTEAKSKSEKSIDISLDLLIESEDETVQDPCQVAEKPEMPDISVLMKGMDYKKLSVDFDRSSPNANNKFRMPPINMIEAFLDDLLKLAAKLAFEPRMRRILDSKKLINELAQLSGQYTDALQQNYTLNEIICEYFINRNEYQFVNTNGENDHLYKMRFMEAINALDFNLERERKMKESIHNLLGNLKKKEKTAEADEVMKVQQFEATVRESLLKDGYERLPLVMNDLFRKMNEVRNEVSKSRRNLTYVQHQLATIKIKSEKMEQQGTGVSEYLTNLAIIQTLNLKICEKEAELNRLKDGVTYDLHTMAHLKEKQRSNSEALEEMKCNLKKQRLKHKKLRDLHYAEIQRRTRLKKEIENVRRGSLLHYPEILRDCAATEEYLRTKREVVQKLRSEYNRLTRRLNMVEFERKSLLRASKRATTKIENDF